MDLLGLLDHGVVLPVLDRGEVLFAVQRHARAAFLLAQRIPHHRDGCHGQFVVYVLGLDRDNAPRRVAAVVRLARGRVLLADLLAAVQDDVEVLGKVGRHAV